MTLPDMQVCLSGLSGQSHHLLENLSTAVLVLDEELRVQYANPSAEQLFATSLSALAGQSATLLFGLDAPSIENLQQALQSQQPHTRREVSLCNPGNGHTTTVDYTVTPLQNSKSGLKQLLIELQPLERLLKINREDNLMAAHQATRALVRGVAHEIKNPLGGIRGAAQLLARELPSSDLLEYTQVIINETDRLRALVERMLGPVKPPEMKRINIYQVLEHVRFIFQAEIGDAILLDRDYDPSLPEICADKDQIIQVVLNLIRNAAQSLLENPQQVEPRIVIRTRALRQITINSIRHRLVCLIEIEDNGLGISDELRETLFYPMVTGRSQGTGLGLPIAQSIMQQHSGLIECESIPGKTSFRILLPFEPVSYPHTGAALHAV